MRAGEIIERALRHHTHGASHGVRGLGQGVEGAIAANGNHSGAVGLGQGR